MNEIDKEMTKIKFKAFGKVKVKYDHKYNKELSELYEEKEKRVAYRMFFTKILCLFMV